MSNRNLYPFSVWLAWVLIIPLVVVALGFVIVASTSAETLLFDNAQLWWLVSAAPVAALIALYGVVRRRRALNRFASAELAPLLAHRVSPSRQAIRCGLVVIAILMITAAIIGPRWGIYLEKQKVFGVDIVVLVDVSRSMLAEDVEPNRLRRAKRDIQQQLIDRAAFQRANRLALLAFAGSTSLRLPLTTDHLAFRNKLEDLYIGAAPRGGTAIGRAIQAATDLFRRSPEEATKIILLFTDGEDHEGEPAEAAREAYEEHGIRTFTVAVGDPAQTVGARVPIQEGGQRKPLLHDGQIVFSKLDVAGLQRIAQAGGGEYAPIGQFHRLVDAMAGLRKMELTTEERMQYRPRYQWFVALALLLLGMETVIGERRTGTGDVPRRVWQLEVTS
jgi:Ca-activated chloride channel family protein